MLHKSIQTQTIVHHEDHTWHIISAESSRRGIHTSNRKRYISFYHRKKLLSLPSKLRSSEFQSSHRFQIKDMHTPWCYQKIFRREYVNQEVQHPSETDAHKKRLKTAETSSTFRENLILSYRRTTSGKQPKPRTRIIQMANITSASRRRIYSHKTTLLGSYSNSLWLATHNTSSLL